MGNPQVGDFACGKLRPPRSCCCFVVRSRYWEVDLRVTVCGSFCGGEKSNDFLMIFGCRKTNDFWILNVMRAKRWVFVANQWLGGCAVFNLDWVTRLSIESLAIPTRIIRFLMSSVGHPGQPAQSQRGVVLHECQEKSCLHENEIHPVSSQHSPFCGGLLQSAKHPWDTSRIIQDWTPDHSSKLMQALPWWFSSAPWLPWR